MSDNDENHVVVDGSNIAYEGRDQPSLRQLDEAVRAFLAEHPHDVLTVVVDATFAHRIDESEKAEYEEAIINGEVTTPPAGAIGRGDAFVLEIAERTHATVLSNDSFQEFHGEHAWLFDDGRLIGGKPIPDVGWVFVFRTPVRGPTSRRAVQDTKKGKSSNGSSGNSGGRNRGAQAKSDQKQGQAKSGRGRRRRRGRSGSGGDSDQAKAENDRRSQEGRAAKAAREAESDDRSAPKGDAGRSSSGSQRGKSRRGGSPSGGRSKGGGSANPLFDAHPVGSRVTGTVSGFASHGAHLEIDGVQCYLPLSAMGDPAPNGAREVLDLDDDIEVVIDGVNEAFGNLDLALPGFESDGARDSGGTETTSDERQGGRRRRWFAKRD